MSDQKAVALIWLGGASFAAFGSLWLAKQFLDADSLQQITGPRRRRHVDRYVRVAPLLTAVSICLMTAGAILRWAVVS